MAYITVSEVAFDSYVHFLQASTDEYFKAVMATYGSVTDAEKLRLHSCILADM